MKDRNKKKTETDNLIDALFQHEISDEKPGPGWLSVWDVASKYNISRSHATKKIAAFMREGKMITKKFRMMMDNANRVVPHYKAVNSVSEPRRTVGKETNRARPQKVNDKPCPHPARLK
jgi:hypothetical protein